MVIYTDGEDETSELSLDGLLTVIAAASKLVKIEDLKIIVINVGATS